MRRWSLVPLVGAAILAAGPGAAWAAPANVTTTFDNKFSGPNFSHDPGTIAQVTWTGGGPHNVRSYANTSSGQPLFSSADVFLIFPASAPINGTQSLSPGDYPFFCTVHGASMSSNLRVTGTPAAGTGPPPDGLSAGLTSKSKKKKCKKGRKRGKCKRKRKRK